MTLELAQQAMNAGNPGEAIIQATKALGADPSNHEAARFLTSILSHVQLVDPSGLDAKGLAAAFAFKDIDHQILAPMALDYLRVCSPLRDALMVGNAQGAAAAAKWLLSSRGRDLLRDPLLMATLSHAANRDLEIEDLLTAFRKILLFSNPKETLRKGPVMDFAITLIQQVEINEYVFAVSDEEQTRLKEIFVKSDAVAKGSKAAVECLVLKALYQPVWQLLPLNLDCAGIKPKNLGTYILNHLAERNIEQKLAANITTIGKIGDETSKNVAGLYEENPYPRWITLNKPKVGDRKKQMTPFFTGDQLAFMDAPYRVLIAGCGTGKQAVDAALSYGPDAEMTCIDISRASLAYAMRKAKEYDVATIKFSQCDILNVDQLDGDFDIIESIGVLHHMADPWEGWHKLIEKLKPGGLMKIALYSKAARRTIAEMREDIAAKGLGDDAGTIRHYRQGIIQEGPKGKGAFLVESDDFYTLSNFRDLMFHVSEQQMTTPELSRFLDRNSLTFKGFHLPHDITQGYPTNENSTDLDHWHKFEEANPDTFKGMYVFWCQKDG